MSDIAKIMDMSVAAALSMVVTTARKLALKIETGELPDPGGADALRGFAKSIEATDYPPSSELPHNEAT